TQTTTTAGMYGGPTNNNRGNDIAQEPQKSLTEKWFSNLAFLSVKPVEAESPRGLPRKKSKLSGKYEENLKYLSTADDTERLKLKRRFSDQHRRFSIPLSGKDFTKSCQASISIPIDGSNVTTKQSQIIRKTDQNSPSYDKPKLQSETQQVIYHELPCINRSILNQGKSDNAEFVLHDPRPKSDNARHLQMNAKTELFQDSTLRLKSNLLPEVQSSSKEIQPVYKINVTTGNIQQNLTFQNDRPFADSNIANKVTHCCPTATFASTSNKEMKAKEIVNKTPHDISRHPLIAGDEQNMYRNVKDDSDNSPNSVGNGNHENALSTTVSTATIEALKSKLLQTKQNYVTAPSEPTVSKSTAVQEYVKQSTRSSENKAFHKLLKHSMKKQKNGFGKSSVRKSSSFVEMKKRNKRISLAAKQIAFSTKKSKQTDCLSKFPENILNGKTSLCETTKHDHDTIWLIDDELIDLTDESCQEEPKPVVDKEAVKETVATTKNSHDKDDKYMYLNYKPDKLIAGKSDVDQDFIVYDLEDSEELGGDYFEPRQYIVNEQDTETTGTVQKQTYEKLEELEHVLTKIDTGIQLTDAEHAVLVASETASTYLKESITVSGDHLYYFPLTLEQMVEESLWIMTHALLRSFGASSTVYSRLLAISQKASVDANVILKGFLDLLCIELCGENGQSLPDILESVHEIARQLKCREIMTHQSNSQNDYLEQGPA
ncbi:MAG: hypothetical protein AB2693_23710, partial [Candidatus Thiodiazotropha sp.]